MKKEVISDKQATSLIILFIGGSTLLFGTGGEAEKDAWLAIVLSILYAFPILMIYARILSLFSGKDLFDILELVFGKFLGKIISLLYVWFALHLGTLVLNDFGDFPTIVSMSKTPKVVPMIFIIFLCSWAIKEGIEVLGRWGEFSIWGFIFTVILGILLLIPKWNINNIKPILYNGIKPVLKGAFAVFSFPFAETILFCCVFSSLKHKKSAYRVYLLGLIIGGILVFITALSQLSTLGADAYTSFYFPSQAAVARINIGYILQRVEVIVSITFFIGGFIKICICLLGACKGIAKVFSYNDYRFIVIPVALLMVNLSYLIHGSIMEVEEWTIAVWKYYSFLFQVILPIIIWITAEIQKKRFVNK